jgi:hypothetical protein
MLNDIVVLLCNKNENYNLINRIGETTKTIITPPPRSCAEMGATLEKRIIKEFEYTIKSLDAVVENNDAIDSINKKNGAIILGTDTEIDSKVSVIKNIKQILIKLEVPVLIMIDNDLKLAMTQLGAKERNTRLNYFIGIILSKFPNKKCKYCIQGDGNSLSRNYHWFIDACKKHSVSKLKCK